MNDDERGNDLTEKRDIEVKEVKLGRKGKMDRDLTRRKDMERNENNSK